MCKYKLNLDLVNIHGFNIGIDDGLTCILVISGSIELKIGDNAYTLHKDDLVVININEFYKIKGNKDNLALRLYISRDYLYRELGDFSNYRFDCISTVKNSQNNYYSKFFQLKRLLVRMKYIELDKEFCYELHQKILFLKFMHILLTNFRSNQLDDCSNMETDEDPSQLSEVIKYIHENYNKSISLKEISNLAYLTPNYFSKLFKKKIGISFSKYLKKIRIENAMKSLISNDSSLTRIALDNGFTSYSSFYNTFIEFYNDTPNSYRNKHKVKNHSSGSLFTISENSGIKTFLRYINKYDLVSDSINLSHKSYTIDLQNTNMEKNKKKKFILNIGSLESALREDFIRNITKNNALGIKYIYFNFLLKRPVVSLQGNVEFYDFDMIQILDSFQVNDLIPIFRITPEIIGGNITEEALAVIDNSVIPIFKIITERFPSTFTENFIFEISYDTLTSVDLFKKFYDTIHKAIKKIFPSSSIGLFSISNESSVQCSFFQDLLFHLKDRHCYPDFITFSVFPNDLVSNYATNTEYYEIDGYHKKIATIVKNTCSSIIDKEIPLYMVSWDTITGKNINERTTYFRSALIMNAIMEVDDYIEGFAFYFKSDMYYSQENDKIMLSLALFLYNTKRPLYYTLEAYRRTGSYTILKKPDIWVTSNRDSEIIVLLWNPIYLNPSLSIDHEYLKNQSKNIKIELKGLKNCKYEIKKITHSRDRSSYLGDMVSSGFPQWYDKDYSDLMIYSKGKNMIINEKEIENNRCTLHSNIDFNGLLMYVIKPIL